MENYLSTFLSERKDTLLYKEYLLLKEFADGFVPILAPEDKKYKIVNGKILDKQSSIDNEILSMIKNEHKNEIGCYKGQDYIIDAFTKTQESKELKPARKYIHISEAKIDNKDFISLAREERAHQTRNKEKTTIIPSNEASEDTVTIKEGKMKGIKIPSDKVSDYFSRREREEDDAHILAEYKKLADEEALKVREVKLDSGITTIIKPNKLINHNECVGPCELDERHKSVKEMAKGVKDSIIEGKWEFKLVDPSSIKMDKRYETIENMVEDAKDEIIKIENEIETENKILFSPYFGVKKDKKLQSFRLSDDLKSEIRGEVERDFGTDEERQEEFMKHFHEEKRKQFINECVRKIDYGIFPKDSVTNQEITESDEEFAEILQQVESQY